MEPVLCLTNKRTHTHTHTPTHLHTLHYTWEQAYPYVSFYAFSVHVLCVHVNVCVYTIAHAHVYTLITKCPLQQREVAVTQIGHSSCRSSLAYISYVGLANDYQEHFSSFCDTLRVATMVFGDIVHSTGKVVNVGR